MLVYLCPQVMLFVNRLKTNVWEKGECREREEEWGRGKVVGMEGEMCIIGFCCKKTLPSHPVSL